MWYFSRVHSKEWKAVGTRGMYEVQADPGCCGVLPLDEHRAPRPQGFKLLRGLKVLIAQTKKSLNKLENIIGVVQRGNI